MLSEQKFQIVGTDDVYDGSFSPVTHSRFRVKSSSSSSSSVSSPSLSTSLATVVAAATETYSCTAPTASRSSSATSSSTSSSSMSKYRDPTKPDHYDPALSPYQYCGSFIDIQQHNGGWVRASIGRYDANTGRHLIVYADDHSRRLYVPTTTVVCCVCACVHVFVCMCTDARVWVCTCVWMFRVCMSAVGGVLCMSVCLYLCL